MTDENKNNDNHPGSEKSSHSRPGDDFPIQQYRLVPVEGYTGEEEDEIDLVELFQTFWKERMFIAKVTGVFLVFGLLVALFSEKEYTASATLMPEAQSTQSKAGSLLQQYGGLLGISGGSAMGPEGTISPQLYPNVVQSLPFMVELLNTKVHFSTYDTTVTVFNFYRDIYSPSILGYLKKYTIGLPGKVAGLFISANREIDQLPAKFARDTVISLTEGQMKTLTTVKKNLGVSVDKETGVITVTGSFPDPQAAAEITHEGINLLKNYMREYRTQKAKRDLEFVQSQVNNAKARFEDVQNRLATFRDTNVNLATAKARTKEQELQSQYDLAFNLYNSLSQQLEQTRLQLQQQTPVFSILQPVSIPLKDNTSGVLVLIFSGVIGVIFSISWILIYDWYSKLL